MTFLCVISSKCSSLKLRSNLNVISSLTDGPFPPNLNRWTFFSELCSLAKCPVISHILAKLCWHLIPLTRVVVEARPSTQQLSSFSWPSTNWATSTRLDQRFLVVREVGFWEKLNRCWVVWFCWLYVGQTSRVGSFLILAVKLFRVGLNPDLRLARDVLVLLGRVCSFLIIDRACCNGGVTSSRTLRPNTTGISSLIPGPPNPPSSLMLPPYWTEISSLIWPSGLSLSLPTLTS